MTENIPLPRTFKVIRNTDVSGVSGAGHVADGVLFGDGTTVLRWRSEHRSTAVYADFETMEAVHGHNGATVFEFNDQPLPDTDDLVKKINSGLLSIDEAREQLGRKPWGLPETCDPLVVRSQSDSSPSFGQMQEVVHALEAMASDPAWTDKRIKVSFPGYDSVAFKNAVLKIVTQELGRSRMASTVTEMRRTH